MINISDIEDAILCSSLIKIENKNESLLFSSLTSIEKTMTFFHLTTILEHQVLRPMSGQIYT